MGIFDNAVSVVIGNKIVDSIRTSDNGVIYERSEHTRLSIDVPLNLTYSDAFNITGHLTTANGTGISGEQVVLKVGNTVVDSTTTTNNGEYSFTQTPVATGNHSFQVVYAGSNSYGSSESSVVTREIGKETLVLTATFDKSKYDVGDTVNITFDLTDDEGNHRPYATIRVNNTNFVYTHAGIRPNKTYSFTYTENTSNIIQCVILGTQNYTGASVTLNLNTVTPTVISTTSSKQVIGSGDSTSVIATLQDQDGDAVPSRSLTYEIKHGSITIDSGSDTTDSNGEIEIEYTGNSIGDVDVIVSYGSLQETFVIIDAVKYDNATQSSPTDIWTLSNNNNTQLDRLTDHSEVTEITTGTDAWITTKINHECAIEFDVKITSTDYSKPFAQLSQSANVDTRSQILYSTNYRDNNWHHVKITFNNGTGTIAFDNGTENALTINNYDSGRDMFFRFRTQYEITSVNFKNFVVYYDDPSINLTSNKDIITSSESATITAQLIGVPYASKTLNYQVKHNDTVLDSGTTITNSSGVATFNYAGTGVGEVDVEVSYSSLQETYGLWDTLKYDNATLSDHTDSFWASVTNITRNDTYSTIGSESSTINIYSAITGDICIEFDVKTNTFSTGTVARITNGSSTVLADLTRQALNLNQNEWTHFKLTIEDNKLSVDGTSVTDVDITDYDRFNFRSNTNYSIDFKNIRIYSI